MLLKKILYKIGILVILGMSASFVFFLLSRENIELTDYVWKNSEDPEYVIEFKEDGTFIEHDKFESYVGTWELNQPILIVKLEDVQYSYAVLELNTKNLILHVRGEGEKMTFTPVIK